MTTLPRLKARVKANFPARVTGGTAISVDKNSGEYTIALDVSELSETPAITSENIYNYSVIAYDEVNDSYSIMALESLGSGIDAITPSDGVFIVGDGTNFVGESGATARTSMGVGAGDSPQFTAVELGHATDTTIARVAAGRLSVEGVGLVKGPASAVSGNAASFSGTTGDLIQDSGKALPAGTIVGTSDTQTLTNKTLTSPTINGGTASSLTSLTVRSTAASFDLSLACNEILTANRTLTFTVGDTSRTIAINGNISTAATFITSGAFSMTLTATGATNVTLPTTGTLATLAGSETLSNKTISSPTISGHPTVEGVTSTGATGTGKMVFDTAPTLSVPVLGSANLTGHPTIEGVTSTGATGTGKFVFDGSPTLTTPNLGTPSAITLTNGTGLPISTGVTGLGTGVATFLATPSSANLRSALTDETGTGAAVFATSPTIATPTITGLITASGGQIAFPATQSPSADANTLDDYEEGTWTPVLTFATPGDLARTYSVQSGDYTKIGRSVLASGQTATSSFTYTTASGGVQITGLPFACAAVSHSYVGGTAFQGVTKAGYTQIGSFISSGVSLVTFFAFASGSALSQVTATDMPSGGTVNLSTTVAYRV